MSNETDINLQIHKLIQEKEKAIREIETRQKEAELAEKKAVIGKYYKQISVQHTLYMYAKKIDGFNHIKGEGLYYDDSYKGWKPSISYKKDADLDNLVEMIRLGDVVESNKAEFKQAKLVITQAMSFIKCVIHKTKPAEATYNTELDVKHVTLKPYMHPVLRDNPFTIDNIYLITPNSLKWAKERIKESEEQLIRTIPYSQSCDQGYIKNQQAIHKEMRTLLALS